MIRTSKFADEQREAGTSECWCLHGAVGSTADWRPITQALADSKIGSRAVDLWRFLDCCPMPIESFGKAFNADASDQVFRGQQRALVGYSMGGRLALHALLENDHPWQAAVIISSHPGLESPIDRQQRLAHDAQWAAMALSGDWNAFLDQWESQAILHGAGERNRRSLQLRRREIARSFIDWSLGNQAPLWERLHEITIPVLWVVGEHDPKFVALAERAVKILPHAQLAIAPASGHCVPWQATRWLSDQIGRFLQHAAQ